MQLFKPRAQDIKQVWFAGVHADIGGGYAEGESAISKFPLDWMIEEAKAAGLEISTVMRNHLVQGYARPGGTRQYVVPDATGLAHNSLTLGWQPLEWFPKNAKWREFPGDAARQGWYLPRGEHRLIPEGSRVHASVVARLNGESDYRPANLPKAYVVEGA